MRQQFAPAAAQFTDEQIDACVELYADDYDADDLTREKATEILHNVTRVYALLSDWARRFPPGEGRPPRRSKGVRGG